MIMDPLNLNSKDREDTCKKVFKMSSNQLKDEIGCVVEEMPDGTFKTTLEIAQPLIGGLIGTGGRTKAGIESQTNTKIHVPAGKKDSIKAVVVTGKTHAAIIEAREHINCLLKSLRQRLRPTHFLCVRTDSVGVQACFRTFKEEVLEKNYTDIDERLFQNENHLHLTLAVCVILDDVELAEVLDHLGNCRKHLQDLKTPFEMKIAGLKVMEKKTEAARVLYAHVDAPDLNKFMENIRAEFQSCPSFTPKGFNNIMHLTLMNSKFLERKMEHPKRTFYNASHILEDFGDTCFGTTHCHEVLLCEMGAEESEFYKVSGSLKFYDDEVKQ